MPSFDGHSSIMLSVSYLLMFSLLIASTRCSAQRQEPTVGKGIPSSSIEVEQPPVSPPNEFMEFPTTDWEGTATTAPIVGSIQVVDISKAEIRQCSAPLNKETVELPSAAAGGVITSVAQVGDTTYIGTSLGLAIINPKVKTGAAFLGVDSNLPYAFVSDLQPWGDGIAVATVDFDAIAPCVYRLCEDDCRVEEERIDKGNAGALSFLQDAKVLWSTSVSLPLDLTSDERGTLWVAAVDRILAFRTPADPQITRYTSEEVGSSGWFYRIASIDGRVYSYAFRGADPGLNTRPMHLYSGRILPSRPESITPGICFESTIVPVKLVSELFLIEGDTVITFQGSFLSDYPPPTGENLWEDGSGVNIEIAHDTHRSSSGNLWTVGAMKSEALSNDNQPRPIAQYSALWKHQVDDAWNVFLTDYDSTIAMFSAASCGPDRVLASSGFRRINLIDPVERHLTNYTPCLDVGGLSDVTILGQADESAYWLLEVTGNVLDWRVPPATEEDRIRTRLVRVVVPGCS